MACECQKCGNYMDGGTRMVMIREELWLSIAKKKDILCDACIEDALGRKIQKEDFKIHPTLGIPPCNMFWAAKNNVQI